ncbi:hypothetical protein AC578_8926 [Pseudocercospora eumusae]|uniref:Uncharacterized protein n=1 Tax=Pseudocercospora eumusae TaxID=321146 RepID=A0A139HMW2_9PEZI|nr:hypothetical protein AC578_8926 [Pseudocercospora eumusae]
MALQSFSAGRILMILGNLSYALGAFLADYNETHVLNPRWPPHAKFHNGQTMSLGLFLAAMSLYLAFRPEVKTSQIRDNLFNAALIGSFYCGAGLCAILYPGTAWQDPEFEGNGEQRYIFFAVCVLMALGYWIDASRLPKEKLA